jgi:hypothetical protein
MVSDWDTAKNPDRPLLATTPEDGSKVPYCTNLKFIADEKCPSFQGGTRLQYLRIERMN